MKWSRWASGLSLAAAFVAFAATSIPSSAGPSAGLGLPERGISLDFAVSGVSIHQVKELVVWQGDYPMVIDTVTDAQAATKQLYMGSFTPGGTITISGTVLQAKRSSNFSAGISATIQIVDSKNKPHVQKYEETRDANKDTDVSIPFRVSMQVPEDATRADFVVVAISTDKTMERREERGAQRQLKAAGVMDKDVQQAVVLKPTPTVTPEPKVDLAVAADGVASGLIGQPLTNRFTISNEGKEDASDVSLSIDLSEPLDLGPAGFNADSGFTCGPDGRSSSFSCGGGSILAGKSAVVEMTVMAPDTEGATVQFTAKVSAGEGQKEERLDNNSASLSTDLYGATDLALTLGVDSESEETAVGQRFGRQYQLLNGGATNVGQIKFQVDMAFKATDGSEGKGFDVDYIWTDGGFSCEQSPDRVVCTGGAISGGEYVTISVEGAGPEVPGVLTIDAKVDPDEILPEAREDNNSMIQTIVVR